MSTANPSALFQIHLVGVGRCREWMSDVRLNTTIPHTRVTIVHTSTILSISKFWNILSYQRVFAENVVGMRTEHRHDSSSATCGFSCHMYSMATVPQGPQTPALPKSSYVFVGHTGDMLQSHINPACQDPF